jgi:hypothetical protein
MRTAILLLAALLAAIGCSASTSPPTSTPALDDGLPASCNPLRTAGTCLLPYPSAIYEAADASTATGYRVALVSETLPAARSTGKPLDATRYDVADGFSPATPILAQFPEFIDPTSLVPLGSIQQSLLATSPTLLVDMTDDSLVAHFSEVDALAVQGSDRQALMIHPAARLAPGRRYAVGITNAVRTTSGGAPTTPPTFAAIMQDHTPGDAMSQAAAARMPAVLASLGKAGADTSNLLLAWDFITGSDEQITGHVLSMRDQALPIVGDSGIGYTITSMDDNDGDPDTLVRVQGTFTVPQFISQTNVTVAPATLTFDANGNPVMKGRFQAPFIVLVPKMAAQAKAPLPILLYGHGLFGSASSEISGPWVPSFANLEGYVMVGTDWSGLSQYEDPVYSGGSGAAGDAIADFDNLPWITDRLQQSLVNAMTLVRTMRGKIVDDPALSMGGRPFADASKLDYFGISLGGIMGGSFMGYDPDVTMGALNVGGGEWSLLFQRSVDWTLFKLVAGDAYPDALDQEILLALAQSQFDFSDPITNAPHTILSPLPGTPKKQILLQMGVGDCQVSNVATAVVVRSLGMPLLAESPVPIWGLTAVPGPQGSALTVWNPMLTPLPPTTNATPQVDNGVHEAIRRITKAEDQIQTFFSTGQIVSTCGGPCGPN